MDYSSEPRAALSTYFPKAGGSRAKGLHVRAIARGHGFNPVSRTATIV